MLAKQSNAIRSIPLHYFIAEIDPLVKKTLKDF